MLTRTRAVAAMLVIVLIAAACGTGDQLSETSFAPPPTGLAAPTPEPTAETPPTTDAGTETPASATPGTEAPEPEPDPPEPDPPETGTTEGAAGAAGQFMTAVQSAAVTDTYRLTVAAAQTLVSSALGANSVTTLDPANPTVVSIITPNGTYTSVDLFAALGPLIGEQARGVGFEIWGDSRRIVLDTTSYQIVKDLNPTGDLGPFEPGISFVDVTQLGGNVRELLSVAAGTPAPDLTEVAQRLPAVLRDIQRDPTNPLVFTGVATYAELLEVQGQDVTNVARSTAAGVALNLGFDVIELADAYAAYYRQLDSSVEVELDSDGRIRALFIQSDLSDLFVFISEQPVFTNAFSASELDEVRTVFADTLWTIESLSTFEPDASLTIPPAPATDDDRTEQWRSFLLESGLSFE